jgi:hypothetical protein
MAGSDKPVADDPFNDFADGQEQHKDKFCGQCGVKVTGVGRTTAPHMCRASVLEAYATSAFEVADDSKHAAPTELGGVAKPKSDSEESQQPLPPPRPPFMQSSTPLPGDDFEFVLQKQNRRCAALRKYSTWLYVTLAAMVIIVFSTADHPATRSENKARYVVASMLAAMFVWIVFAAHVLNRPLSEDAKNYGAYQESLCNKTYRLVLFCSIVVCFSIPWIALLLCDFRCHSMYFPVYCTVGIAAVATVAVRIAVMSTAKTSSNETYSAVHDLDEL